MLNKSKPLSLFLLLVTVGSTYHIYAAEAAKSENAQKKECHIPGFDGPVPPQVCYDLNTLKNPSSCYQVKTKTASHHRLFYGASGNGLRRLAKAYAASCNSILIEYDAQEIVDNYKKFGKTAIESIFKNARDQAAKTKQKVFLCITNIDELQHNSVLRFETPQWRALVATHRLTLKLLFAEAEKDENDNIFIIWSTHKKWDIPSEFLQKLQCPQIGIENPDRETRWKIFFDIFYELNINNAIEDKYNHKTITTEDGELLTQPISQELNELNELMEKLAALFTTYGRQYAHNESCWFEQDDYQQTREALINQCEVINQKIDLFIKKLDSLLSQNAPTSIAYDYYNACKEFIMFYKRHFTKLKFFAAHTGLFIEIAGKTAGLDKRSIESLALNILEMAYAENNGEITEEIIRKNLDQLPYQDIETVKSVGKGFVNVARDLQPVTDLAVKAAAVAHGIPT